LFWTPEEANLATAVSPPSEAAETAVAEGSQNTQRVIHAEVKILAVLGH